MNDFTNLQVWQKARSLSVEIYRVTDRFPPRERFGLADQLRRAGVSVCTNVAEGWGRGGDKEFARFLRIARGSANEVHCCAILAADLGFLTTASKDSLEEAVVVLKRMLTAFLKRLGYLG